MYSIRKLSNEDTLLVCLTKEFLHSDNAERLSKDNVLNGQGNLIIDRFLLFGDGENRFLKVPFKDGHVNLHESRTVEVSDNVKALAIQMFYENLSEEQKKKLVELGWTKVKNWTMIEVLNDIDGSITASEPLKFDEKEEAVKEACQRLSKSFGLTQDEIEETAIIDGYPLIISFSKYGRSKTYIIFCTSGEI